MARQSSGCEDGPPPVATPSFNSILHNVQGQLSLLYDTVSKLEEQHRREVASASKEGQCQKGTLLHDGPRLRADAGRLSNGLKRVDSGPQIVMCSNSSALPEQELPLPRLDSDRNRSASSTLRLERADPVACACGGGGLVALMSKAIASVHAETHYGRDSSLRGPRRSWACQEQPAASLRAAPRSSRSWGPGIRCSTTSKSTPQAEGGHSEEGGFWPLWSDVEGDGIGSDGAFQHSIGSDGAFQQGKRLEADQLLVAELTHYSFASRLQAPNDDPVVDGEDAWEAFFRWLVVSPGSLSNFVWEIIGSLHIAYDICMIPMSAFELPKSLIFSLLTWSTTLYWSVDLPYRFFVSFEHLGMMERNPKQVALNYLQTWFVPDLLVVIMDWIILVTGFYSGASRSWRMGKLLKAFRILRAVRLIRIIKFLKILANAMDKVRSTRMVIYMKATYMVLGVFLCAHYIGCYWYTVGTWEEGSPSWVTEHRLEAVSVGAVYLHSLYWSLAQSGFGAVNMYPTNDLERLFASGVSLVWLLLVMACLSKSTVWGQQLREVSQEQEKQEMGIRRYLTEFDLPRTLRRDVLRFFRLNGKNLMRRTHASDIQLISNLPVFLRMELHRQVYMPVLGAHPCFRRLPQHLMDIICCLAMTECHCPAGKEVFMKGTEARAMIFVCSGELSYYYFDYYCPSTLTAGDWICEAALWVRWKHVGCLLAKTSCELLQVDASRFLAIMSEAAKHGFDLSELRSYARLVTEYFCSGDEPSDHWNDLPMITNMASAALTLDANSSRDVNLAGKSWSLTTHRG